MSSALRITAGGFVDRLGFAGSSGLQGSWSALGVDPLADKIRWPAVFPARFPEFRHLDRLGRVLCLAAECAGLAPREPPAADDTALVFASAHGCLDSDHHFERSLGSEEGIAAGLFPFTLTSTGLGALAIRYGLRGPTLALSVPPGREGRALREATELVEAGEASRLVLCLGDWVGAETARALCMDSRTGLDSRAEIVALVIEPGDPGDAPGGWPSVGELLGAADPVSLLIRHVRLRSH